MDVHWLFKNKLFDHEMGQELVLSDESWANTKRQSLAASSLCQYGTFRILECFLAGLL